MIIKKVVVGSLLTNCYILTKNNKVLIIDPGDEAEKIINEIKGDVVGILVTHRHDDHIKALDKLVDYYKCKVYEYKNVEEKRYSISDFNFEVIYTPGHRNDLICFYFYEENVMFVGDFIFAGSIGRWDLLYGDVSDMKKSIKKILLYDENIILYPGHYQETTLKEEKANLNYYLNII